MGLGPLFGDPWRTTGTPLTDPLEEQPFHHRMTCPGCPPPLQNTTITKTRLPTLCQTFGKYSSPFSELSEILKSPNTYNSCAGESPGPIHAHTLRCTSTNFCKHTAGHKKKAKIRRPSKKLLLLLDQWVRETLAFERLANIRQEKKVWDHPGDLFLLF